MVGRPFHKFGSGREALLEVWQLSGGPPGCPGVVGNPSRMCGGPPGCPGVVGMQARMTRSGCEVLPDVLQWL